MLSHNQLGVQDRIAIIKKLARLKIIAVDMTVGTLCY